MSIPKLPAPALIFRRPCEETPLIDLLTCTVDSDFVVRSGHNGQVRRKRIDPQVVAPLQFDVPDDTSEVPNARRGRCTAGENQTSLCGHKEGGGVHEVPAPRSRSFLRDIVSDSARECPHTPVNIGGKRRRGRLPLGRSTAVEAAGGEQGSRQKKGVARNTHEWLLHDSQC